LSGRVARPEHSCNWAAPIGGERMATHRQIEIVAYRLWLQRGCPEGTPDVDWREAEQVLSGDDLRSSPRAMDQASAGGAVRAQARIARPRLPSRVVHIVRHARTGDAGGIHG